MLQAVRKNKAAVLLILAGLTSAAQTASPKGPHGVKETEKPLLSPTEEHALTTLAGLFQTSKLLKDEAFAIKIQSQIADALWDRDRLRARRYFMDAFGAIDSIASIEDGQQGGQKPSLQEIKSRLRREIARTIARRDPGLAESLLKSWLQSTPGQGDKSAYLEMSASTAGSDLPRALALARSGLAGGITPSFIAALSAIRMLDPVAADGLFYESLAVAASNRDQLGASLSLLASYVFWNQDSLSFGPGAPNDPNDNPEAAAPAMGESQQVITDFLNFALQQNLAPTEQEGINVPPGVPAYVQLIQLLPYYQQYMPDAATAIAAGFNQLTATIPDAGKRALLANLAGPVTASEIVQAADSLATEQKDLLYERAAIQAFRRGNTDQALQIAGLIGDLGIRERVQSVIYERIATQALNKGDIDTAYRNSLLIPGVRERTALFAEIIRVLLAKKETAHAADVLNSAERLTVNTEDGPEKARGLLLLASLAEEIDLPAGITAMQLAVAAVNHSNDTGVKQGAATKSGLQTTQTAKSSISPDTFNFHQSFVRLGRRDFDTALSLALSIEERRASMLAQVAVCQGSLVRLPGQLSSHTKKP